MAMRSRYGGLPDPPLPATMTSREEAKNCSGSTRPFRRPRRAQTSHHPRRAPAGRCWVLASAACAGTRRRRRRAVTRREAPVDIIEVSGLVDEVVADDVDEGHRAGRGRAARRRSSCSSTRKAAVVSPERMARLAEAIHGSRSRSPSGSGRAARVRLGHAGPAPRRGGRHRHGAGHPHRRLRRPAARGGLRAGLRRRRRPAARRSRWARRRPGSATCSGPASTTRACPCCATCSLAIDGLEHGGRTVNTAEERRGGRRRDGARARGRAPVLQAAAACPG